MKKTTKKIPLLAVVGPTASGKTGLAIALAHEFDGEVVSADSMQIYKRMNIATAKPTQLEMDGIPHHLVDFVEPDDASFSVAGYARMAHKAIADIHSRGKLPILAGGTGLYVDAIIDNIDYSLTGGDQAVRDELLAQARTHGGAYMLEQLRAIDPEHAKTLHPNNQWRILRAIEVYRLTGIPMSEHQRRSRETPERYALCMLGLNYTDRAALYDRVNRRVDLMLEAGLLEEAREISRFYGGTARQAIGYKELQPYLDGSLSLEACVANLKQATRRYAKRQLTWFRRDERIHWLYPDKFESFSALLQEAKNTVHNEGFV